VREAVPGEEGDLSSGKAAHHESIGMRPIGGVKVHRLGASEQAKPVKSGTSDHGYFSRRHRVL